MASVFDVAVLGTSLTTGPYARGWVSELATALQAGKRSHVRTHALGKEGQTSNWGLANVQPLINLKPRVALVEFINDAYGAYQSAAPENMTPALSKANFEGIVDAIKAGSPDTRIYLMTLVRPTAAGLAASYPALATYDAQLAPIATAKGVGFIDLRAVWGNPADYPDEYPSDGVHVYLPAHIRVTIPQIVATLSPHIV